MWIFTKAADLFDKTRKDNDAWIDQNLQSWEATTLYDDSPWYRNVGVWAAGGTLYALNKFTTTVASGFVDVLRLGDGVQEGGWGYAKDSLRLLMFLGPATRGARYFASLIPAVDMSPTVGNCGWVAAARLLRLTGTRPWAQVSDLARWMGLNASETGAIESTEDLLPALRHLRATAQVTRTTGSMEQLAQAVAENPKAATMFGIRWTMNGKTVGHVLIAVRNAFGGMTIIDRSGRAVKTLAELGDLYPSIGTATVDATAVTVQNSVVVRSIGTVPSLMNIAIKAMTEFQPSNPGGAGGPPAESQAPLPPDAQRLYNALPPNVSINWKQVLQMIKPPLNDPYGSLLLLERTGRISVTRLGGDELNIVSVRRL
jgi:hypothetical protein